MIKRALFLLAGLLCSVSVTAKPVKIVRNTNALEFSYEWPGEAAAVPALEKKFRSEMAKAYQESLANAREDLKLYKEQQRQGIIDFYSMQWTTAGESSRLLSLQNQLSTFTGGAHPNTSYNALLWDRKLNRQTSIEALMAGRSKLAGATRATYCKALDAERARRREGEKLDLPEFNACPKYSDLAIAPLDKDRNGRFDALDFVASPYLVGPYAEGEYAILQPVTAKLIEALKPEYRSSFEVQRQ